MNKTVTRKVGVNRGKKRIWIEGTLLVEAGFVRGADYSCTMNAPGGGFTLRLGRSGRKVTGKEKADGYQHPIIDLIGDSVAEAVGDAEAVEVNFREGVIRIRPVV